MTNEINRSSHSRTKSSPEMSRRRFIGTVAAGAAVSIVPRYVLGGPGYIAPREKTPPGWSSTSSIAASMAWTI